MLLVVDVGDSVFEVAYMWLPMWMGMNTQLCNKATAHMNEKFAGKQASPEDLHEAVVDFFCGEFPQIKNLRSYLSAAKDVSGVDEEDNGAQGG